MEHTYKCEKCGCKKTFIKPMARRFGIYCKECDSLIKWITYDEAREIGKQQVDESIGEQYALRKIKKINNVTRIYCSKCGILLYNSLFPKPQGQFNLVNAKGCPNCLREFI